MASAAKVLLQIIGAVVLWFVLMVVLAALTGRSFDAISMAVLLLISAVIVIFATRRTERRRFTATKL